MYFTKEKLVARVAELAQYRYRKRQPITGWQIFKDDSKCLKYPHEVDGQWRPFAPGDKWVGHDAYYWFQTDFTIPEFTDAHQLVLLFDFGSSFPGGLGGSESLLFVDDHPYQGVDGNHHETYFDATKFAGKTVTLTLKAWTGRGLQDSGAEVDQEYTFSYADFAYVDRPTYDFYYLSNNLIQTIQALDETHPDVPLYTQWLNHAINLIDFVEPGSSEFYASLAQANDYLQAKIDAMPKQTPVTVSAVGHTHIDVAWLWQLKNTREKIARSFSTVLRLMDEYPDYVFFHSSPQMYQYIKEDYPEIYTKIKERVKEGRWEVGGAMWLEADCNIPSGEALTRQILLGKGFFKREFDQDSTVLWLPDVFGYSWALPQILKKSGVDTFITTKISWNEIDRMPHDTFMWRGMDGTEVLTHFITTPEPGRLGDPTFYRRFTYNGYLQPNIVKGIYDAYKDKEVNQDLLLAYGYGDGGGGVNRNMLENRREMDRIDGLPWVKPSRIDDYVDRLHHTVDDSESYVQHWDGELYLEFHRGTYTNQANNKLYNRKMELALRNAEITNTMRLVFDHKAYPAASLNELWITLARNQFHDIIPGSSINEVYRDSDREYQASLDRLQGLIEGTQEPVTAQVAIQNTSSWTQTQWVKLPQAQQAQTLVDAAGDPLPYVDLVDGRYVQVPAVAPTAVHQYPVATAAHVPSPVEQTDSVETTYYRIKWNQFGQLLSVYDKLAKREVLAAQSLGNQLQLFEDKPLDFNAWNIDLFYNEKKTDLQAVKAEVLTQTEAATEVQFTYEFGHSKIVQVMRIFSDERRIDFITHVDWHEKQRLMKVAFPVDIRASEATYDIQYGNVKRPTHWNTSWDLAKFETVGHQWADLSETDYGVSLLNDSKYGYDIKDNVMRLSLLRSSVWPDPVADEGEHTFTYSLYPHMATVNASDTQQAAWALNSPFLVGTTDAEDHQLFSFAPEAKVALDAVKLAEDGQGLIVRLHDYTGGRQTFALTPQFEFEGVEEDNLMEEQTGEVDLTALSFRPYEIKTLRFRL
ncbi:alpha-mannosidase [Lacticaseibacillus absianus]|uniref:alpha-mannosidase n=1 Tax=Lacticaseibacillus absianus TaxID=2729623 RepID=UPI0015CD7C2B|nr:alpha-mannosidase [Lacticaseibacillus absianus]